MLSDKDVYSQMIGSTEEQKQERRQLADDLLRFTVGAFGDDEDKPTPPKEPNGREEISETPTAPSNGEADSPTPTPTHENGNASAENSSGLLYILLGGLAVLIVFALILMLRKRLR